MAWTADGSEIFFGSPDTGMRAVPAAGGASRFVVDAFAAIDPDLSRDGRSLVYGLNGSTMHIADLGQNPPVATDLSVPGNSPRFSPDGSRLAFVSGDKVSVMDLATRTVTDVMDATNPLGGVDWFADGLRLVTGADHGIDIVTLGPPVQRRQILDNWAVLSLDLSPDGTSVAFGVNGPGSPCSATSSARSRDAATASRRVR
jgi:TolB protein